MLSGKPARNKEDWVAVRRMKHSFSHRLVAFVRSEQGNSAIEYALLVSLISVAIASSVGLVGQGLGDVFDSIAAPNSSDPGGPPPPSSDDPGGPPPTTAGPG